MASLMRMPGVSADAEEATLLEWSVDQGSELQRGDVVATVETDKANVDIEADEDAVVWRLLAEPGTAVAVGSPIAVLLAIGEEVDDESSLLESLGVGVATRPAGGPAEGPTAEEKSVEEQPADPGINVLGTVSVGQMEPEVADELEAADDRETGLAADPPPKRTLAAADHGDSAAGARDRPARVFASPIARRLANEHGISVQELTGTGPGGRIVRADVAMAIAGRAEPVPAPVPAAETEPEVPSSPASAPATSPSPGDLGYTDTPHSGMRRAVAAALTASKRDAPHFYLTTTCRVDDLLALRETVNSTSPVRVSVNDFFVKAVARSLREFPEMNVRWTEDAVRSLGSVDVSVAVASSRGLVTPVIRSADTLTLTQVSRQVRDFAARADEGGLKQHELEGGSLTVTNLGMFGVESFSAIINPPQVAILAVGAVVNVPLVVDGGIEVGRTVTVTVSADHRPVDGVLVARWLQLFKSLVENPLSILV